ncbi:MAG TPA: hypothetical protein VMV83_13570 [Rectinemataceae bacterium]|nr:hypothetical protein [Rectinemataceae bacterium]
MDTVSPWWISAFSAEGYASPFRELEREVDTLHAKVQKQLKKMGAAWK